ncbi:hypothetical protein D1007_11149 [Hordeum vulgare]|nr:hypothetical protein D1007_11149 [Hordeum vulgare]
MHLFVRQYMRLLFDQEANENYEERRTKISLPVMKVNTPLEFHASKIYTRAMFDKFGEVLYEAGQYKVLDFLGIDKIPLKHILKRWTKDARDILPDHLVHLQKDKISVNSITFRHSNLYTHALEVVKLGDANPIAYDCAMELLRAAMDKLTPLAAKHDGLGLENRIEFDKSKDTELSLLQGPKNGCGSDDEGIVVGNFIGLSAPERKRKAGRPTNSRDKPPYDDRGAKSKKCKLDAGCSGNKRTRFCTICGGPGHKSTKCPQRRDTPKKKRKEPKCSICGVGGHPKNTCNTPKIVLHVAEQATSIPGIEG